ncbi:MAG: hypothetical protein ABI885_30860, partial [Gammaproteobacteria bacterium]
MSFFARLVIGIDEAWVRSDAKTVTTCEIETAVVEERAAGESDDGSGVKRPAAPGVYGEPERDSPTKRTNRRLAFLRATRA